jgi:hypothetical protein
MTECAGWYSEAEQALLRRAAEMAPPGIFVEIGVYKGLSARVLHEADPLRRMWLYDDMSDPGAATKGWPRGKNVFWRQYDPTTRLLISSWVALLHHDAVHTEDVVGRHLALFGPVMVKGGLICLHDYVNGGYPGVQDAWLKWSDQDKFERVETAGSLAVFRRVR